MQEKKVKKKAGRPTVWTREHTESELKAMIELIDDDQKIIMIKDVCLRRGYSSQLFMTAFKKHFENDEELGELLRLVKDRLEVRLVRIGLIHPAMPIFLLKNNYGYRDQIEEDLNIKEHTVINYIRDNAANNVKPDTV